MNIHKHALTYAMSAVIVAILIAIGIYVADLPSWVNFLSTAVLVFITVLGLKNWRDKQKNGIISYGKAMGYSTFLVLYYCIAISIWSYIFFKYIGPDQLEKMRDEQLAKAIARLKEYKVPEDQWETSLGLTRKMFTPGVQLISALVGGMFFYTIINLIVCAFMKKDPPATFDDQSNSSAI